MDHLRHLELRREERASARTRPGGPGAKGGRCPSAVLLAAGMLGLPAAGVTWLPVLLSLASYRWMARWQQGCASGLVAWLILSGLVLGTTLGKRLRWAWAPAVVTLTVRGATFASLGLYSLIAAFRRSPMRNGPVLAGASACCLVLTLGLFASVRALIRAGDWYGVDPRRRWATLRREGWWALVLAGLAEGAFLVGLGMSGW